MKKLHLLPYWLPGVLYLCVFALHTWIVLPLEIAIRGPAAAYASLMFLPAGVKLLSYYLCREKSLVSLFIGIFVAHAWLYQSGTGAIEGALIGAAVSALSLPVIYHAAQSLGLDIFRDYRIQPAHWLHLLIVALMAALINGVGLIASWWIIDGQPMQLSALPNFALGDTLGAFVFLLLAMFAFRWTRAIKRMRIKP